MRYTVPEHIDTAPHGLAGDMCKAGTALVKFEWNITSAHHLTFSAQASPCRAQLPERTHNKCMEFVSFGPPRQRRLGERRGQNLRQIDEGSEQTIYVFSPVSHVAIYSKLTTAEVSLIILKTVKWWRSLDFQVEKNVVSILRLEILREKLISRNSAIQSKSLVICSLHSIYRISLSHWWAISYLADI